MNFFFDSYIVKTTSAIVLLGFFIRLLVVLYGYTVDPIIGVDQDALTYHMLASQYAEMKNFKYVQSDYLYVQILGTVYYIFSSSLLVGGIFSSLIWLLSAVYLNKSCHFLGLDLRSKILINIIYSFVPSSIIFTSATLREPIYLLIVNLTLYLCLNIFFNRKKVLMLFFLMLVLFFGQQLHFAMHLYSYVIVLFVCLYYLNTYTRLSKSLIFFVLFVSAALIMVSELDIIYRFIDEWRVFIFNKSFDGARTTYPSIQSDFIILDLLAGLVNYLFTPFIWQVSKIFDIVVLLENLIRFIIVFDFLKRIYRKDISSVYAILILMYLSLEFLWSIGTTNWGTAIRHHIPGLGIMVILFAYSGFAKTRFTIHPLKINTQ